MAKRFCLLPLFISLASSASDVSAGNILTVHDPLQYGASPAFIDTCILEIEPHGSYIEQSLILTYSDHGQYSPDTKLEVVHQFELPKGAVINDLWLWMPDTVMKAIVIDTWTAQTIYDSIVSRARDPAFLSKKGNQFKLQVYPVMGGSYRKIRLNFITPTRWLGNQASAALPLAMLQADHSTTPMVLLFRAKEDHWDEPFLMELPDCVFSDLGDSAGYHIKKAYIEDISTLDQLNLAYSQKFDQGYYFQSYRAKADTSYFQLGLAWQDFFDIAADTAAHNHYIGLDLSGAYGKKPDELFRVFNTLLPAIVRAQDTFQLAAVAGGLYEAITPEPQPGDSLHIDQALEALRQSAVIDSASTSRKKRILYCDSHAAQCWRFQDIDRLAVYKIARKTMECLDEFLDFDVVAAYDQGFEEDLSRVQADSILMTLDAFFRKGGRFLTFFDYNRDNGREKVASTLIPGLQTKRAHIRGEIHGVPTGIVGRYFLASAWANTVNELAYNQDPEVKVEVVDDAGEPVVISKQIHNGLLVVSGIWSFGDDDTQRATFGRPLLGLTHLSRYCQLPQLLDSLVQSYGRFPCDRALIFSNSDSLIPAEQIPELIANYLRKFGLLRPRISSVNLLDGKEFVPPYVNVKDEYYYGNGYFMKLMADSSGGLHFESHNQDWDQIQVALGPQAIPPRTSLTFTYRIDSGAGNVLEQLEVAPDPHNTCKPSFFIGKIQGVSSFHADVKATFWGMDTLFEKSLDLALETDTTKKSLIIPTMLANEHILQLYTSFPIDTARIVALATQHNLLTDFTAMLCLEPADTFRQHICDPPAPTDRNDPPLSVVHETGDEENVSTPSALSFNISPNPFNNCTSLVFTLPYRANVHVAIYNFLGELVYEVNWKSYDAGTHKFIWDGRDTHHSIVASGIYLVRFTLIPEAGNQRITWTGKMILIR